MGLQNSKYMSRSRGGRASHTGNGTDVDERPESTAKNQTRYPVSLRFLRAGISCRSTISRLIRIIIIIEAYSGASHVSVGSVGSRSPPQCHSSKDFKFQLKKTFFNFKSHECRFKKDWIFLYNSQNAHVV